MPPLPDSLEDFLEIGEDYEQRHHRHRRFGLPPPQDLAESASEPEQLQSRSSTGHGAATQDPDAERPGIERRHSQSSYSLDHPRRHSRDNVLARSTSPSTIGPVQLDYDASFGERYDTDYANYLQHPAVFDARHGGSGEQSSTPSYSGGAPTADDVSNMAPLLPPHDREPRRPQDAEPQQQPRHEQEHEQAQQQAERRPAQADADLHDGAAAAPTPSPILPPQSVAQPGWLALLRRKRTKTPKLDWHALEYVGPYDENLDCPICRSPLVRPEITTCFHIFCHKCLAKSLQHGNRCPIDRNPIQFFETPRGRVPARAAPHIVVAQLDNLQVRCPNARCDIVLARSLIEHHYKVECAFTKIACSDPSCGKLVTRRDSEEGSCLHKAVDCVYCGKPVELASLDDHYDADCNQKELMCEHCLAAVPRHRHDTHVANCAERRIACKYRTSGCTYASKKRDFNDHESTCLYGMIMRMNRAHRADMNSMESVLQDSQDRVRKLEAEMATRRPPDQAQPASSGAGALLAVPPAVGTAAGAMVPADPGHPQPHPHVFDYPSQPPVHPPLPLGSGHHSLDGDYDAAMAAGGALAQAGGGSARPETPPVAASLTSHGTVSNGGGVGVAASVAPAAATATAAAATEDSDRMNRIVAYIDIFDAKVENLERYLGEVDARQAQLFMNELGPLKDQILELRNSMGHISMYVRWLMESFRQTTKRSVGLRSGNEEDGGAGTGAGAAAAGGASGRAAPSPSTASPAPPSAGAAGAAAAAFAAAASQRGPLGGLRGPPAGMALPTRRLSDRENPPRL